MVAPDQVSGRSLRVRLRPLTPDPTPNGTRHGDLAENAEYHAAREKQSFIEGRIQELERKLGHAEVIDPPTDGDRVTFGSTVRLEDADGKEACYWIVGSDEAAPAKGKISIMSSLARTLIGKEVGQTVTAQVPAGKKTHEILAVNFPWPE